MAPNAVPIKPNTRPILFEILDFECTGQGLRVSLKISDLFG
jgi:hypothetical protein